MSSDDSYNSLHLKIFKKDEDGDGNYQWVNLKKELEKLWKGYILMAQSTHSISATLLIVLRHLRTEHLITELSLLSDPIIKIHRILFTFYSVLTMDYWKVSSDQGKPDNQPTKGLWELSRSKKKKCGSL